MSTIDNDHPSRDGEWLRRAVYALTEGQRFFATDYIVRRLQRMADEADRRFSDQQAAAFIAAQLAPFGPASGAPADCGDAGHADGRCGNASCMRQTKRRAPDFDAVRDKRLSELTPAQQDDARELWIREHRTSFAGYYLDHVDFLLQRLDEARNCLVGPAAKPTESEIDGIADETVKEWDASGRMPPMAFDFRGLIADGVRRALMVKARK